MLNVVFLFVFLISGINFRDFFPFLYISYLPDCPDDFAWPGRSSLTGDIMSNWMGVSGATRESKESAERAVESDPSDPVLLVRAAGGRDCLQENQNGKVRLCEFRLVDNAINHRGHKYNIPELRCKTKQKLKS